MILEKEWTSFGWTMEDIELILHPMIMQNKKKQLAQWEMIRLLQFYLKIIEDLHHFFRQNFSQVTNPPIDSLRERVVMSLRTRIGNLSNILDEDQSQCDHLQLNSPSTFYQSI